MILIKMWSCFYVSLISIRMFGPGSLYKFMSEYYVCILVKQVSVLFQSECPEDSRLVPELYVVELLVVES